MELKQLQTWAKPQELDILPKTYSNINTAIHSFKNDTGINILEPYLQGSYGNTTHIYGKGDIDVVVQLDPKVCSSSNLSATGKSSLFSATYDVNNLFVDLFNFLNNYYKYGATGGSKTIKINHDDGKKAVDVVVAHEYRKYKDIDDPNSVYTSGIMLKDGTINYPKLHKKNGENKNSKTNKMFKSYVRIFKNANKKFVNDSPIFTHVPSYFIECLLFNIPDSYFDTKLDSGFNSILAFLNDQSEDQLKMFVTQSSMQWLFGDGTDSTRWTTSHFNSFLTHLNEL